MKRFFWFVCGVVGVLPVAVTGEEVADYSGVGRRVSGEMVEGKAVTTGVIRVRRRHENDMDFGKYNPFYWEGRGATFTVVDHTPLGVEQIDFVLETEWPQDATTYRGSDLSAIYIGDPLAHETERSKFAINARMDPEEGARRFSKTLDAGAFAAHAEGLKKGTLLVFEFRFFNDESHPGWAEQKARNPHNLSAYYSEFLRVRVGEPGLLIDDPQVPNREPAPARYAGGWTTIPTLRVEPWTALQQMAANMRPESEQPFLTGRTWFHTDVQTGKHVGDTNDDKPSVFFEAEEARRKGHAGGAFNARSCNACHGFNAGAHLPEEAGVPIHTTLLRMPHDSPFGKQVQTAGEGAEGVVTVARWETREERLDDGTVVELRRPVFAIDGKEGLPISPRRPQALVGMGLLGAVGTETVHALAKGSGGVLPDAKAPGRFGWKASEYSLGSQVLGALEMDMGVPREDGDGRPLRKGDLEDLIAYVSLLGVPPRMRPDDPLVVAGERLFGEIGCAVCHVPTMRTGASRFAELEDQVIHPYTDLALHDMGEGLADATGQRDAAFWRTAPLWGLKNTRDAASDHREEFPPGNTEVTYAQTQAAARENPVQLLHDGRARSLAEAILWHGGEAEASVEMYRKLGQEERGALRAFIWDL